MAQRLIDADALTKSVIELAMDEAIIKGSEKTDVRKYQSFLLQIAKQKIIEAVLVIRCKDCKHSKAYYHGEHSKLGMITYFCTRTLCNVKADDYCSWSERKE